MAAPRVAIGNDINGNLMILQVNGYEPQKLGLNVYEMTDLLLFLGFQNAINLDGGGSATTFIEGYPTLFVSWRCVFFHPLLMFIFFDDLYCDDSL